MLYARPSGSCQGRLELDAVLADCCEATLGAGLASCFSSTLVAGGVSTSGSCFTLEGDGGPVKTRVCVCGHLLLHWLKGQSFDC